MYVTRPLSMYHEYPSALTLPPPEGPNSGILVIQDEEAEPALCFGLCRSGEVTELPFPQNKKIEVRYSTGVGPDRRVHYKSVAFIPVLDLPLSANRYYAIKPSGKRNGEALSNSKEEEMVNCCFCCFVCEKEPQPLDPNDVYQQFEIHRRHWGGFVAKSVAPDGFPPHFLRRKGWKLESSTSYDFQLGDAPGLDDSLRARLPSFNFPLSDKTSPLVVVGKWYCPFMFVKEGRPKDQLRTSMYYEMTLEQRWEQIFTCQNDYNEDNVVVVDTLVEREVVTVAGRDAAHREVNKAEGVMWFRIHNDEEEEVKVGMSLMVVERMKWEQERFGWVGGNERKVRVKRIEQFGGDADWRKYGCYVLVERFVLRRMNGSLVLTYDFKHIQHIRSKKE